MKGVRAVLVIAALLAGVGWAQTPRPAPTNGGTGGAGGSGTVTSVAGSGPAWLTWTITNPTTAASISLAPTTAQSSHQVIGTCNAATTFAPCPLVSGDLPAALSSQTSINGLGITASTGAFAVTNSKTFSVSNTLTLAGTDGSTLNVGAGGTLGSNAFTSTAYAPLASPTFTGTVTIPTGGVFNTPTSMTATNVTGLPIAGLTGLGSGVAAALAANVSGSGAICLATGSACATSGAALLAAANNFTVGPQNITLNALATTQTDGWQFYNTTAAANNAQQISPSATFQAAGWNTTTPASNAIFGYIQLLGVQGTSTGSTSGAGVDGIIQFQTKIGANSSKNLMALGQQFGQEVVTSTPVVTMWLGTAAPTATNWIMGSDGTTTYTVASSGNLYFGTGPASFNNGITGGNFRTWTGGAYTFTSSGNALTGGTPDVSVDRDAAGILGVVNATAGTTAANYRAIKASAHYIAGTTFTASGCSNGTLTGGASAGTFTLGANSCNVVVTMGNSATAPNGWSCRANDQTANTILIPQGASSTTTATFEIPAGAGASDVINFACLGY